MPFSLRRALSSITQGSAAGGQKTLKPEPRPVGIELTEVPIPAATPKPALDLTRVDISYQLIPQPPAPGMAFARIRWEPQERALVYYLLEPKLDSVESSLLDRITLILPEKLEVDFSALQRSNAADYITQKFHEAIDEIQPGITQQIRHRLLYYIQRDFIGLERIEPLMQDRMLREIAADGAGLPIWVKHKDLGSIRTNIKFERADELDLFVQKLALRSGRIISPASPFVDTPLPDGSRMQATLGVDIATRGSNFTIIRPVTEPLTPTALIRSGTLDARVAAYLWIAVERGVSFLIAGWNASGRTAMMNAMSQFIPQSQRIVTVESVPELRLLQPHWVSLVARKSVATTERHVGELDIADLVREGNRQNPDWLLVGELTGREAQTLFAQIASGCAAASTMQAENAEDAIGKLGSPPFSVPNELLGELDLMIVMGRARIGTSLEHRLLGTWEVTGWDSATGPKMTKLWNWNNDTDSFETLGPSVLLKWIADMFGLEPAYLQTELVHRARLLSLAAQRGIVGWNGFAELLKNYLASPDATLSWLERGQ